MLDMLGSRRMNTDWKAAILHFGPLRFRFNETQDSNLGHISRQMRSVIKPFSILIELRLRPIYVILFYGMFNRALSFTYQIIAHFCYETTVPN
jgi:hypothetical protein